MRWKHLLKHSLKYIQIECGFRFQWFLATIVGFLVSLCFVEIGERPDIGPVEGAIGGAAIGLAQWFVLRQQFSQALWWVLVNAAIWGLMGSSSLGALGWVTPSTLSVPLRAIYGTIDGVQLGALIGVAQWLVLRQQVDNAWRWIVASTVSWSLGLVIGWSLGAVLRQVTDLFLGDVIGLALVWVVVAVVTGFALIGLKGYWE